MQYRINTTTVTADDLLSIDWAISDVDPAAVSDLDPAGGVLRVSTVMGGVELVALGRAFDAMAESLEARDRAREEATRTVARWRASVAALLDAAGFEPSERLRALMSPAGVQSLVVAGAIGVSGARRAAADLLGSDDPTDAASAKLSEAVRLAVDETSRPFLQAVRAIAGRDLAERLRLRASELKGHLRG